MNLNSNIVTLSPAERSICGLCGITGLDGRTAPDVLAVLDAELDGWHSDCVVDVVNMRIIERVRANLALMSNVAQRPAAYIQPYSPKAAR